MKLYFCFLAVYKVTELLVDLSSILECEFERHYTQRGEMYPSICYQTLVQSMLEFSLSVNGTKCGLIKADYA